MGCRNEAVSLGNTALNAQDKALGPDHAWTKDSARGTANALDALGRTEEAKALREKYGVASSEDLVNRSGARCEKKDHSGKLFRVDAKALVHIGQDLSGGSAESAASGGRPEGV
jgi:hypothetical protein